MHPFDAEEYVWLSHFETKSQFHIEQSQPQSCKLRPANPILHRTMHIWLQDLIRLGHFPWRLRRFCATTVCSINTSNNYHYTFASENSVVISSLIINFNQIVRCSFRSLWISLVADSNSLQSFHCFYAGSFYLKKFLRTSLAMYKIWPRADPEDGRCWLVGNLWFGEKRFRLF